MLDAFALLRERALRHYEGRPDDDFLVRGIWKVELAFRPNPDERTFFYTFWLVMTRGQGCCYCTGDDERGRMLVGRDAREIIGEKSCISIATLDALYASVPRKPAAAYEFSGDAIQKTDFRTGVILSEAERLLTAVANRKPRVVNVGVVGNVIRGLRLRGFEVMASDLERDMVGRVIHGVKVEDGSRTLDLVGNCDLAIVTGMTIATDTLEMLVETASRAGAKLLIFAETGANFGEEYCRLLGIDAVVSEPFPFYIFQGVSRIEVYRK